VGIYGNNVVSIFAMPTTTGTFPTLNLVDSNTVYVGNYRTSSVVFSVNGMSITWTTDYFQFKVGSKIVELPLSAAGGGGDNE
jgi:hypothetical protein